MTTAVEMKRTWTSVGAKYNATDRQKTRLAGVFDRLQWQAIPCDMAAMPGMAIKTAIQELRIPKASHVASSHELAPYGLVAIRGHFTNGTAQVYVLDEGCSLVVLASDHWPIGGGH